MGSTQGRIPSAVSGGSIIEFANGRGTVPNATSCPGARQLTQWSRATLYTLPALKRTSRAVRCKAVLGLRSVAFISGKDGKLCTHSNEPAVSRQGDAGSAGALDSGPTAAERAHPFNTQRAIRYDPQGPRQHMCNALAGSSGRETRDTVRRSSQFARIGHHPHVRVTRALAGRASAFLPPLEDLSINSGRALAFTGGRPAAFLKGMKCSKTAR